jgi:branched-chain amino acid transport system ATP-binding protein
LEDEPILRAVDVEKRFGGLQAVAGVSLDIRRGGLTGIIGPNGAGKTTLFNVLAGFFLPDAGQVFMKGEDITDLPPHERSWKGLARTFQITRTLGRLTVLENLLLGPAHQRGERVLAAIFSRPLVAVGEVRVRERAEEMLRTFGLSHLQDAYAGSLSGGQRKLLELARALMTDPSVVLLDEPMAGVAPKLASELLDRIDRLRKEQGITFVLVEHDLETVFARCDPVVVLANGKKVCEGPPEVVQSDQRVLEAYLGA